MVIFYFIFAVTGVFRKSDESTAVSGSSSSNCLLVLWRQKHLSALLGLRCIGELGALCVESNYIFYLEVSSTGTHIGYLNLTTVSLNKRFLFEAGLTTPENGMLLAYSLLLITVCFRILAFSYLITVRFIFTVVHSTVRKVCVHCLYQKISDT